MRGHREQVADEARHEVRAVALEDTAAVASDPHAESGGQPTGETRAAANREEDPPA
jgi:hypothetical protein